MLVNDEAEEKIAEEAFFKRTTDASHKKA